MIALTDCRANASSVETLKNMGFEVVLMPPSPSLQAGVASHTDMLIFIGFGRLFCHESYYNENKNLIDSIAAKAELSISLTDEVWSADYPHDVLFNACQIGNKLICNEKTVSKKLLDLASQESCQIVKVAQGYTKCSLCKVSECAIITSDKAIARACDGAQIDVLLISEGHVSLPPYNFGFIGGASGQCSDNVYFCGSLDTHPDSEIIKEFCKKHKKNVISLSECELQDVGSIFFIGE